MKYKLYIPLTGVLIFLLLGDFGLNITTFFSFLLFLWCLMPFYTVLLTTPSGISLSLSSRLEKFFVYFIAIASLLKIFSLLIDSPSVADIAATSAQRYTNYDSSPLDLVWYLTSSFLTALLIVLAFSILRGSYVKYWFLSSPYFLLNSFEVASKFNLILWIIAMFSFMFHHFSFKKLIFRTFYSSIILISLSVIFGFLRRGGMWAISYDISHIINSLDTIGHLGEVLFESVDLFGFVPRYSFLPVMHNLGFVERIQGVFEEIVYVDGRPHNIFSSAFYYLKDFGFFGVFIFSPLISLILFVITRLKNFSVLLFLRIFSLCSIFLSPLFPLTSHGYFLVVFGWVALFIYILKK